MSAPDVSVLVPVRDEGAYLPEALASLSAQTFSDFEAIVVDDGSSDGSPEIAEAHARVDRRFRVVRQDPAGIVAALESARAEARGSLIARLDGDDVALPGRLEAQVDALGDPGLAACGGRVSYFPEEAVRDGARRYEAWLNGLVTPEDAARDVFVECPLPHPALTIRADVLAAVGGYRARGWPEDYDLVLRLWAAGHRFRNVEEPVLRWREHEARRSRSDPAYALDAFVRCKVHHLRATLLRGFPSVVVWGAGPVGKSFARELDAQGTHVAAFVDVDPRKIGHDVHGAPVVAVEDAPRFRDSFAGGAVAGEVARTEIREAVAAEGRRDGVDFVAVA
ncbi:MAG TPA: glycosyltransferase [Gaiellaceae bacterium]|nr:glycosyltransferase [Gaiellaceae bacterium]